jgi:hypothetical protein
MLRKTLQNWGTYIGEARKNDKKISLSSPPPSKHKRKKKQGTLSACLGLPIGCMKFLFPKDLVTIFGLG